ncbi:FadR/GntR family transcriptional regulator [Streptacidiphilus fuscans]|uniref:FadR family transcriptional regulator n=1 Tax=Streptacidiphilus fuscans TaxID=2789292 RepID=A0A931B1D1_9ACTN|nr:GntR family transcriptional regulator [Streptacidiphilus fuscans]MBF9068604.1 FadR family transcriptional regulator [Streptacidiphilus fuscans]
MGTDQPSDALDTPTAWEPTEVELGPAEQRAPSHAVVADALRTRITLGGFAPGARLPTERDLAAALGVGRNTVRQALRQLADEGLVVTTPGRAGGTRVRAAEDAEAAPSVQAEALAELRASLRDYMEYRAAIEPLAARLAAERGPTAARRALVRMLDEEVTDLAGYHRMDSRFHLAVAAAAGNEVLREAVTRARTEMFVGGNSLWLQTDWGVVYPEGRDLAQVFREEHLATALAVLAGDGAAAEASMRRHLLESAAQFTALLDRLTPGGGSGTAAASGGEPNLDAGD